ncbi:MAG: DUF3105 domain-containing protein, partial [Acidimicrobiia bacterium]|nr:DUF3105 domain-containing protein [Acidimicrobiia bacterium]
ATLLAPTGEVLAVESSLNTDFAQTLATSVSPLPTEPVGVGAVWTVETTFEALGAATHATTTYTITAIEGSLVSLEFETVQEIDLEALLANPALADAEVSLTQGGTGRTVWDLATGDTIESEFDLEQILIATAEFQGVESTLEQVILNSFEIPSPAAFSPPDGTEAFVVTEATHVDGAVDYDQDPPVGGPHSVDWVTCGYYEEPVSTEMAVHSMEHGAVWITYREGLAADEVAVLEAFDGMPYVLISPYPGLDSPVVASAWGVQLRLDSATDPRLAHFVDWFAGGPQTPEPGASC